MKLRRHERLAVYITTVAQAPAQAVDVDVLDLSVSGCRIRSFDNALRVGATVVLRLSDTEEVAGQLVWVAKDEGGVEFYKMIGEHAVDKFASAIGERQVIS